MLLYVIGPFRSLSLVHDLILRTSWPDLDDTYNYLSLPMTRVHMNDKYRPIIYEPKSVSGVPEYILQFRIFAIWPLRLLIAMSQVTDVNSIVVWIGLPGGMLSLNQRNGLHYNTTFIVFYRGFCQAFHRSL